jgi:D-lactate dehydrogenase (cytochrome)
VDRLIENLRAIVGRDAVLADAGELLVYECDGLPQHKHRPRAVVFPSSTEETSEIMRVLATERVPFTPRGAGTGLSGGALALNQGVVIEMARLRRILKVDPENRIAVVQPGVVNAHVSRAAAPFGLHYVPDPSSNTTCTIGGNIAENAGGIHCLKYGTTTDHVLGVRAVLSNGDVIELGGNGAEQAGYDLLGCFVGSEGTFGIATEATLRLVPVPPAVRTLLADFLQVNDASHAVSAIIAAGVMPAGLEMMDREIIRAVEASVFAAGLPLDAGAALLIELDGIEAGLDEDAERVRAICIEYGARSCRLARDDNERKKLWAARKGAFGAIGRIAPDSMIQDAVVPRSRLPEVLDDVYRIAARYNLRIANVFHAGDGNLHPLICFDSRSADEVRNVKEAGRELMATCVRAGGSITGEHGVGFDKRELLPLIFSEDDMDTMLRVRAAFDPLGLMNPGKIIPLLRGCGEGRVVAGVSSNGHSETVTDIQGAQVSRPQERALTSPVASTSFKLEPGAALPKIIRAPSTLSPASTDELREVLHRAAAKKLSLLPVGAGTWQDAGNQLDALDLVVNTSRLNRIIEHEPADLIASAEAGVTLSDFNTELARRGQWLPLDPPDDGRATLGGVVATGLGGAQKIGYGPPRGFVIGMKVVLADGRQIKAGGRVVKNVAGYDLCKLFTGSYGTLGVIAELTFKLRPLPQASRNILACGNTESLLSGARALVAANLFPVAVELLSPAFAAAAEFGAGDEGLLLIRFSGLHQAVQHQSANAVKLLRSYSRDVGPLEEDDAGVWHALAAIPLKLTEGVMWRASVPSSQLARFVESVCAAGDSDTPGQKIWQANPADGRIRVIESPATTSDQLIKSLLHLRAEAQSYGGSLIIERAPVDIKNSLDAWGDLGTRRELMWRIKQQLDPEDRLSPGRFGFHLSAKRSE